MIGQVVPVSTAITQNGGNVRHSGINWNARLDQDSDAESIAQGERVTISGIDGNVLIVK